MRANDGFPTSWGSTRASVYPHHGPSSYAVVTYSPYAAGDTTSGAEAGLKYFDFLVGGLTDSGNFFVQAAPIVSSIGPVGTQAATYRLKWVAAHTATIGGQAQTAGTEAVATTDLSGETVRLLGIGPK